MDNGFNDSLPDIERTIHNVPVDLNVSKDSVPSRFGLQVFGENHYQVDVTVKGKSYVISKLTADDIKVTAQTKYISSLKQARTQSACRARR